MTLSPQKYIGTPASLELLKILLLVAITSLVYAHTLHSPFVLDDSRIYDSHHLRITKLDSNSLVNAWQNIEPRSRPLANTSFAINYFFHRYKLPGYHIVNIAIHIITGLFLFFLLRTTLNLPSLRSRYQSLSWLPFFGALLWLVHPSQTQSVTYVVQRMNSMAAMFYVIALFSYIQGRLAKRWWLKLVLFGGAVGAGLLSLKSKEIALTLPVFIVLYDWYFLQDLEYGWLKKYGLLITGITCLLVLATFFVYLGKDPFSSLLAGYGARDFTLSERLLTESRVVIFYLTLLVFPAPGRLNLDHDFVVSQSLLAPANTIFSLAALGLLLGSAVFLARQHRLLSFGIIWFFGNLAIESSVIPLEIIFDHRLYLPSMMLIMALAATAREYWRGAHLHLFMIALAVALLLSFWTYQRNQVWVNPVSLWGDCVKKSPNRARSHNNLGKALLETKLGPEEEAEYHLRKAIHLNPSAAEVYNNLGNIRFGQGKHEEAIKLYAKAIELNPNIASWHFNIGDTLVMVWRLQEGREHFKKALALDPWYAKAQRGLSRVNRMIARSEKKTE